MKQQNIFVIFCLVLTLGILLAYDKFKEHFSDAKDLQKQVAYWKEQKDRVELRVSLLRSQMQEFQLEVAKNIPESSSHQTFEQKNLFSQLRIPASELKVDFSAVELEQGRKLFREQNYSEAVNVLQNIISKYPISGKAIEARFLLSESLYLSSQYASCIDQIEEMMTQYPENELTGFIMLRMGQILQTRNRKEEAMEVYRTVIRKFSGSAVLREQAQKLLSFSGSL